MIIKEPPDGFTMLERIMLREIVLLMYKKLDDPMDKFILIARHESGYKQEEIAKMVNMTQVAVHKRLKKISELLKKQRKMGSYK